MLSHFHLYGELRFLGVTGRRNVPSGLREDDDDDDDDDVLKFRVFIIHKLFFSKLKSSD